MEHALWLVARSRTRREYVRVGLIAASMLLTVLERATNQSARTFGKVFNL